MFRVLLRAFNDKGITREEVRYYKHEPSIMELSEDLKNYVQDEAAVYAFDEYARYQRWYGGFDILGWEDDEEEEEVVDF